MARIRTIKPEFWADSKSGMGLSDQGKLVFLALLNESDDYGVLRLDLQEWAARLFPYGFRSVLDSDNTLRALDEDSTSTRTDFSGTRRVLERVIFTELIHSRLLELFSYAEKENEPLRQYVFITNFSRHQKIDRPSKPLIKGWKLGMSLADFVAECDGEVTPENDDPRRILDECSTSTRPWKGKERKGKERKGYSSTTSRERAREATVDNSEPADMVAVPTEFSAILSEFGRLGFEHRDVHNAKTLGLIRTWLSIGVTCQDIQDVTTFIRARDPTLKISPAYIDPVIREYLETRKNGTQTRPRSDTGKKSALERMWDNITPGLRVVSDSGGSGKSGES